MHRLAELSFDHAFIVCNEAHYFLCHEQLEDITTPLTYILEPCARNTAPAIATVAHHVQQTYGPDALLLILPSDQWFADPAQWTQSILRGAEHAAQHPHIVTFGIQPTSPKTGYGYIEMADACAPDVWSIQSFREKPDLETAQQFIQTGQYVWNSGLFICRAGVYLNELKNHALDIYQQTHTAVQNASHFQDYIRLDAPAFSACTADSIDYAIMEKSSAGVMIKMESPWNDLGCWTSVAEAQPMDENGNALHGNIIAKDSYHCLISSETTLVTTLGIRDQIIVATSDAILIADKKYSQQVKDLVASLQQNHTELTHDHQRVARPWGYYETLAQSATFKVKRLMIKPGASLSLQSHQHRAEHWVIVDGEATIINDDQTLVLSVNQSTYIPPQTKHRLTNKSSQHPLFVIEVQSGSYLGEDDIMRFDDLYHRTTQTTTQTA